MLHHIFLFLLNHLLGRLFLLVVASHSRRRLNYSRLDLGRCNWMRLGLAGICWCVRDVDFWWLPLWMAAVILHHKTWWLQSALSPLAALARIRLLVGLGHGGAAAAISLVDCALVVRILWAEPHTLTMLYNRIGYQSSGVITVAFYFNSLLINHVYFFVYPRYLDCVVKRFDSIPSSRLEHRFNELFALYLILCLFSHDLLLIGCSIHSTANRQFVTDLIVGG